MKRNGFTLIELLVVISIIGIILTIFTSYFGRQSTVLKKEVFKVYNNLQNAKMYAIKNRVNVTITFYPDDNYYKIKFNDSKIITFHLDKRIEFGDGGHSDLSNHKVGFDNTDPPVEIFTPMGFAKYMGSIYLKLKENNDKVYQISVKLNGKITIKKWNGNEFVE